MKRFVVLSAIATLLLSSSDCSSKKNLTGKYKGRLEVKGMCMNYTIRLLEGDINKSLLVRRWTDETTHKEYENVFALGSRCNFPDSIKQGDEFYFEIDSNYVQKCMVCLVFYPTPSKKLFIKVVDK